MEVKRAHYDQLQDILNRKYMGRDDAKYDDNHNVLSDKLGLLWSLPAAKLLSPSHLDDTEASDEDEDDEASDKDDDMETSGGDVDMKASDEDDDRDSSHDDDSEIDSLFPFSFMFLDLSTLELKFESDRFTLPLLLREEYDHISRLIDKGPRGGRGSVILSGQPGTGEPLVCSSHRL